MPFEPNTILPGTRLNALLGIPSGAVPQAPAASQAASLPAGFPLFGTGIGVAPDKVATPPPDFTPMVGTIDPAILAYSLWAKPVDFLVPRFAGPQTMTKLAQSAIRILDQVNKDNFVSAVNTIVNKGIAPKDLMDTLEQRVKFPEVMSELAKGWSQATQGAFVEYFGLAPAQFEVMDAIVSLAILNDPMLEAQLRRENTPSPTPEDLLDGRRIVYQYPPAGSVLEPPYVILLAVEHVDTQAAQNVVNAIIMELADYRVGGHTFRVTRSALQKVQ